MSWRRLIGRIGLIVLPRKKTRKSPTLLLISNTAKPCEFLMRSNVAKLRICAAILASALTICAASNSVYATEPTITSLAQGDPAPFDGDLYPVDVSIRWALEIEGCAERAALELDHEKQLHAIEIAKQRALAEANDRANKRRLELLQAELETTNAWYRSPVFVATAAATIAVAGLLISTILVQSTIEVQVR